MRVYSTTRDVIAGCFVCWGADARWHGPTAQGTAARHHDATGHQTWCDVAMSIRYGEAPRDDRQVDLEDAIAAQHPMSPEAGRRPVSTPHPLPDAPTAPPAGESAPESRSSRHGADRHRGARGHQPETALP